MVQIHSRSPRFASSLTSLVELSSFLLASRGGGGFVKLDSATELYLVEKAGWQRVTGLGA